MRDEKGAINITYQWYRFTCFRHLLRNSEHEDAEGKDDSYSQGNLLTRVRGQAEDQDSQARHHHTREHNVVHVVQSLPTYSKIVILNNLAIMYNFCLNHSLKQKCDHLNMTD